MRPQKAVNGHQARADETRGRLLIAAEIVFVRDGFEGAQLATIAQQAGRTKGSIYGHYASKDDLFLALYEHRGQREMARLTEMLEGCHDRKAALAQFKVFLSGHLADKTWSLLTLEFKLYALRHPEARERISKAHNEARLIERRLFERKLYGKMTASQRRKLETATAAISPIVSALTLERYFEPTVLAEEPLQCLLSCFLEPLLQSA